jgi:hypothetical protein
VTAIADVVPRVRVKIQGRIELLGAPLRAPVSGRTVAGYSVSLFERAAGTDGEWRRLSVEDEVDAFLVRDGSGVAVVRPRKIDVVWSIDVVRDGVDARPRRSEEAALVVGEAVTIVGMARLEPDPAAPIGYRQMATRPVFESTSPSPLFVVDGAS